MSIGYKPYSKPRSRKQIVNIALCVEGNRTLGSDINCFDWKEGEVMSPSTIKTQDPSLPSLPSRDPPAEYQAAYLHWRVNFSINQISQNMLSANSAGG